MKEIIICAAIKMCDGAIIRGHRHVDCIMTAQRMRYSILNTDEATEGFVTSKNRFVDRVEAMKIQKKAGIKSVDQNSINGEYNDNRLFSEDLY